MKLLALILLLFFHFHTFLGCHDNERAALLSFKSLLVDPSDRLSSWEGLECCVWHGIECSNTTHVITIDLRNPNPDKYMRTMNSKDILVSDFNSTAIAGTISPSLFTLRHLEYLDLSFNNFNLTRISSQFNNLEKLAYLNLSNSVFSGSITTQFANLSTLKELDLSCSSVIDDLSTLSNFNVSSFQPSFDIRFTYMKSSHISSTNLDWLRGLMNLRVLRELSMADCRIFSRIPVNHFLNLTHLSSLEMGFNFLLSFPPQIANLSSLSVLDLSDSHLQGAITDLPRLNKLGVDFNPNLSIDLTSLFARPWPDLRVLLLRNTSIYQSIPPSISNSTLLSVLMASTSFIPGPIPLSLFNLSNLVHLNLGDNNLIGELPSSISGLKSLEFLFLHKNRLSGQIPKSICEISSLQWLVLAENSFSGSIPNCIGQLLKLEKLYVGYNSMDGSSTSLTSLFKNSTPIDIFLSSSGITVKTENHPFPSNFQPQILSLRSCSLRGKIPDFISRFEELVLLDLGNNSLSGTIPSWLFQLPKLAFLSLSSNNLQGLLPPVLQLSPFSVFPNLLNLEINNLQGPLPLLFKDVEFLFLSENNFTGEIPAQIGWQLSNARYISLSGNKLSGEIPQSLCPPNNSHLQALDLSNNDLGGNLPSTLGNCISLTYLNLGWNHLTGSLPSELGYARDLGTLQLNDNHLNGQLPDFIWRLQSMEFLILGNNKFHGQIPPSVRKLRNLKILGLNSNSFNGSIPNEITQPEKMHLIVLSSNKFCGPIPTEVGNFRMLVKQPRQGILVGSMISIMYAGIDFQLVVKGSVQQLPPSLYMLNLSKNAISGSIPSNLGNMSSFESLDLSFNSLDGKIPDTLASLDSLSVLNLAHNNLSGKVPSGPHFDTLSNEGSAYVGNHFLCGPSIGRSCQGPADADQSREAAEEHGGEEQWFSFESLGWGYLFGLLGPFVIMGVANGSWCNVYWRFVDWVASMAMDYLPSPPL
ncbi:hypothetical protein ACLOJK_038099 [Asimina triloba]